MTKGDTYPTLPNEHRGNCIIRKNSWHKELKSHVIFGPGEVRLAHPKPFIPLGHVCTSNTTNNTGFIISGN